MLGGPIIFVSGIGIGKEAGRSRDIPGRLHGYFLDGIAGAAWIASTCFP